MITLHHHSFSINAAINNMFYITLDMITPCVCLPGKAAAVVTLGPSAVQSQTYHRGRVKRRNLSFNPFIFEELSLFAFGRTEIKNIMLENR